MSTKLVNLKFELNTLIHQFFIFFILVQFCELDIIGNAILLFAAGSETVTYTASYCLYELAMNKDIQSRLRAEIISVKEKYNGELNNDFLMDLHYADMVLDGKGLPCS